jgi:hypothetical protein
LALTTDESPTATRRFLNVGVFVAVAIILVGCAAKPSASSTTGVPRGSGATPYSTVAAGQWGYLKPAANSLVYITNGKEEPLPFGGTVGLYPSESAWADSCPTAEQGGTNDSALVSSGSFAMGAVPAGRYFFIISATINGQAYMTYVNDLLIKAGTTNYVSPPPATTQIANKLLNQTPSGGPCQ